MTTVILKTIPLVSHHILCAMKSESLLKTVMKPIELGL